jgi:predicted GIY-YIG superfamily endonuclease
MLCHKTSLGTIALSRALQLLRFCSLQNRLVGIWGQICKMFARGGACGTILRGDFARICPLTPADKEGGVPTDAALAPFSQFMYVLRCADGSLYAGYAVDVAARAAAHNAGRGAKYTRGRGPVTVAAAARFYTKHQAMRAEWAFKQLPRAQKEAVLAAHAARLAQCAQDAKCPEGPAGTITPDLIVPLCDAKDAEGPKGSVGVNSRLSAVPEAKPSGREGCELLSFELPGGEAGVGIQNVCKSSGTPERASAAAENEAGIRDAEGVTGGNVPASDTFGTENMTAPTSPFHICGVSAAEIFRQLLYEMVPQLGPEPAAEFVARALFAQVDALYAAFTRKLIPSVAPARIMGVRTPALRRIARQLAQHPGAADYLATLPHATFEEMQVHAFALPLVHEATQNATSGTITPDLIVPLEPKVVEGVTGTITPDLIVPVGKSDGDASDTFDNNTAAAYNNLLAAYDAFLPHIDNWATADQLPTAPLMARPQLALDAALGWLGSPHPYARRFGIVLLMRHFLPAPAQSGTITPDLIVPVFDVAQMHAVAAARMPGAPQKPKKPSSDYYVDMARAWYFAEACARRPQDALPFLHPAAGLLDEFTRRRAIQKATESARVPTALKATLRSLKTGQ